MTSPLTGSGTVNRWRIHSVLLVTVALTLTGISIVNVALPSIRQSLGATESDLQWVLAGYALSFGVTLIPAGRLGDLVGRPRLYLIGVLVFATASIVAGLAGDVLLLNLARVLQGIGSGLLSPQILGMIQQYFQGAERARALGAYGTVVAVSMGMAPLLGGLIIDSVGGEEGWRWTFFVNVPVSATALVLALLWFPRPVVFQRNVERGSRLDLDLVGSLLLGLSIFLVLFPFATPIGGYVWGLLPVGVAVLAAWVLWERRYKRLGRMPMVDLGILSDAGFSSGVALATVYFLGITAVWVIVAVYLQLGIGFSAFQAGLIGLPSALLGAISARWAGRHVYSIGRRIVSAGIVVALVGLVLTIVVLHLSAGGWVSPWWLLLTLAPIGAAQGSVISPNQTITLTSVPLHYAGSSGGVLQTGQRVGSAIGVAVITAILFSVQPVAGWETAATAAFGGIILALCLALAISLRDQHRRRVTGGD
ncbi:MFS transporter [Leifsonia bigeumensis]|uniref:MFS transporter n=1 Tax=Leifsonella bigeumensis TaxID=433643 RepID=A0ABP7FGA4_9MICO